MTDKQTKQLQELISEFEEIDNCFFKQTIDFLVHYNYIDEFGECTYIDDEKLDKINIIFEYITNKNSNLLIKLNKILDEKDRNQKINKLEQEIKIIQEKKYITVEDFEKIYNVSKSSQRDLRSRLRNPLPYHQKVAGGKIVYVVNEVEKWFENQYK